jgi:hypothetical protein
VRARSIACGLAAATLGECCVAFAYRPFVSTDAAVAEPRHVEVELGAFTVEHDDGDDAFVIPELVMNVGLTPRVELVGQLDVRHRERASSRVEGVGVFLKGVVREGILQGASGPSVAVEIGPTLPCGGGDDDSVGFEAVTILSVALGRFVAHLNAGGGRTQSRAARGLWGVVVEVPVAGGMRVVSEVDGESTDGARPANQALLGGIWESSSFPLAVDVGVRRGLSDGAPDWALTAGLTFDVAR